MGESPGAAPVQFDVGDVLVPLDRLLEGPNHRQSGQDVTDVARSLDTVGQLHPVVVRKDGDKYVVVSGHRRLKAARELGWSNIRVHVLTDQNQAALASLDENLVRASLSKSEWAQAFARQKALYEEIHPGARHGGSRASLHNASLNERKPTMSFIEVASLSTRKSSATLSRRAKIGSSGTPAVMAAWEARDITEVEAAKTSGLPAGEQNAEVERLMAVRAAAKNHAPGAQLSFRRAQPPVETPVVGAVADRAAAEERPADLEQEECDAGESLAPNRGTAATQPDPEQAQAPTASVLAPPGPGETSSAPTDSEEALGVRAVALLEQWCGAVMAGEGTATSLKQVSLGQKMLGDMVLILRPKFPMKPMASA